MKLVAKLALIGPLLIAASPGQTPNPGKLRSAHLEAAVAVPGARVAASQPVGALESGDSHALLTALVVADSSRQGQPIRRVRFDFSMPGWKESVYLDEQQLHFLKETMDKLAIDVARLAPEYANSRGEGYIGVCDMANQPDRFPITVDYRVSWYPALVMRTPSLMIFPDRTPADLGALVAKAVEFLAEE